MVLVFPNGLEKIRKIYRKLNEKKIKELHGWLKDHSNVVTSPNANDTVWVIMDDGEKVRETKYLCYAQYVSFTMI